MSLRQQIVSGFAVLLVPVALVALVAFATVGQLGGAVDAVLADNERSLAAASEMDVALERLDSAALLALLGRTAEAEAVADSARPRFQSALAVAEGNLTIGGEGQTVESVGSAFGEAERAFETIAGAESEAGRAAYASAFVPAFERARDGLGTLRALNRQAAEEAGQEAQGLARTTRWTVGLGGLVAVALGIWAAARLSQQIAAQYEPQATP